MPKSEQIVALENSGKSVEPGIGGTETILIVEDDDGFRNFLHDVLKKKGYKVIEAGNGEDALRASKEYDGQIDLMITDIVMPKLGGKAAAEQMVNLRPRIKILYMSGYTDDAIAEHGILSPNLNFLQKPFSAGTLTQKVREVLDTKQV